MRNLLREAVSQGICVDYLSELLAVLSEELKVSITGRQSPSLLEPLSERELEVLRLTAAGLSNQEIADKLFISLGTVKSHLHHIYGKLDARGRTQAIARARELKLL